MPKKEQDLELTKRQRNVLLYIKKFQKENGYYPTLREVGLHFKINFSSIRGHLMAVEKKGYIKRGNASRAIKFLKEI